MFSICNNIIQKNKLKPHKKTFGDYTFSCFEEIHLIPEQEWNEALKNQSPFLSLSFLMVLHHQKSDTFRFRYVIVYQHKKPVGVVYFQINDFSASVFGDLVFKQIKDLTSRKVSVFQRYINQNENETILRLVTCGNNLISGEHGFFFNLDSKKIKFKLVEKIIESVSKEEKLRGRISAILVKDFYEEGFGDKNCWYCKKFSHFNVEPNMIIDLPSRVTDFSGYLNLFSKKYRNRAKHILQASSPLIKKQLTLNEVVSYNGDIHKLYSNVFHHAKFKLVHLSKDYFIDMSKNLATHFYIDAWFLDEKMVSFASGFILDDEIEAHLIGFDYDLNKDYDLYQTLLYSYIQKAFLLNKKRINLGRTASEIKTTVGAKPHELICYIKPQNTVSKLIMKPFMQFLQPSDWTPRNPFKEE